jgi:hypothetical protein
VYRKRLEGIHQAVAKKTMKTEKKDHQPHQNSIKCKDLHRTGPLPQPDEASEAMKSILSLLK